uniref:Uncharacterized protein n=1 Tax=Catagonus wagneri TaxID=51154 RepID=A0A8C3WP76_9CETA
METQRASLCLGRWSLWLLLLGLVVPPASAQALSYRQAVLRAVDRLNKQSSGANLYRLLELDQLPKAVRRGPRHPETCELHGEGDCVSRMTQRPPELCDFKENGLVKQCVGTVTLDQVKRHVDITCNEVSSPFLVLWTNYLLPNPGYENVLLPWPLPDPSPRSPGLALLSLEQWFFTWGPYP